MPGPAQRDPGPADPVLALAVRLAPLASLSESVDLVLPVLAAAADAPVAIFAVAGSEAAGARCWPSDPAWSRALEAQLGTLWEGGPFTQLCRELGVVPPVAVDLLMRGLGWTDLPFTLLVGDRPLRYLAYVPVAALGRIVSGYFLGRTEEPFGAATLDRLGALQGPVVAAHGRFLRGADTSTPITPRQREILGLLQRGLTSGAIASRLGISDSTVGKHVHDLYARLDTHDRVSTVREAQVRGLLDGVAGEPWQDARFP